MNDIDSLCNMEVFKLFIQDTLSIFTNHVSLFGHDIDSFCIVEHFALSKQVELHIFINHMSLSVDDIDSFNGLRSAITRFLYKKLVYKKLLLRWPKF